MKKKILITITVSLSTIAAVAIFSSTHTTSSSHNLLKENVEALAKIKCEYCASPIIAYPCVVCGGDPGGGAPGNNGGGGLCNLVCTPSSSRCEYYHWVCGKTIVAENNGQGNCIRAQGICPYCNNFINY